MKTNQLNVQNLSVTEMQEIKGGWARLVISFLAGSFWNHEECSEAFLKGWNSATSGR